MAREPLDLLQGTLDVLVLRTLSWQTMHGYAISRWIRERTKGVITIEDAPLYKALHRLERDGCGLPRPGNGVMRRLFSFPWRSRRGIATDVENELAFHVDSRVQELVATALAPDESRARIPTSRSGPNSDEPRGNH